MQLLGWGRSVSMIWPVETERVGRCGATDCSQARFGHLQPVVESLLRWTFRLDLLSTCGWCCLRLILSEQWIFCWKKPTVTVTGVTKKGESSANHKTNAKPIWLPFWLRQWSLLSATPRWYCCNSIDTTQECFKELINRHYYTKQASGTSGTSQHPTFSRFWTYTSKDSENIQTCKHPKIYKNVARQLKISNHPNNHPPLLFPYKKGSESCGIPIRTSQWLDQLQDIMNSHLTGLPWILSWMWSFDD